jgi:AcrR family transcriptional regulator
VRSSCSPSESPFGWSGAFLQCKGTFPIMSSMQTRLVETTSTRRSSEQTREHVLSVAEELFPTTLYRLFASKDDLVAAYVDRYAAGYQGWIDTITSTAGVSARDRIVALFDGLATITGPETFRGCPFLMTLAEYPDKNSAAHLSAQAVKAWVRAKLRELVGDLADISSVTDPDALADQLVLIVEGLYASTAALGVDGPARQARTIVETLLDAAGQ